MDQPKQPPGRPRDSRVDEAVTVAVRALLHEVGYAKLTLNTVAERAGVGRAAIYRRYASKHEMVFAAVIHGSHLEVPPDTGSLLGDLTELARVIIGHLSQPAAATALMHMLAAGAEDATLAARFGRTFVEPELRGNAEILQRAVRRGELDQMPDLPLFHALFGGTVLSWLYIAHQDPAELPERLSRFVCAALGVGSQG